MKEHLVQFSLFKKSDEIHPIEKDTDDAQKKEFYSNIKGVNVKDSKGHDHFLNGKGKRKDGSLILCRDLSLAVALTGIKKNLYQAVVADKENIERFFSQDIIRAESIMFLSHHYEICGFNGMGGTLKKFAENLAENEECTLLCNSENHAMAITVRHKIKREQEYYVVKFYDPNFTGKHKSVIISELNDFAELKMSNFLSNNLLKLYFPSIKSMCLMSLNLRGINESPKTNMEEELPFNEQLYWSLEYGWSDHVAQTITDILNQRNPNIYHLLEATSEQAPGLNKALQFNHAKATEVYVKSILNSSLTSDDKVKLIEAKREDGVPGFNMALQLGHSEAADVYLKLVLNSSLNPSEKVKLLEAQFDGDSGLYKTLFYGHSKTTQIYVGLILNSSLESSCKVQLLKVKGHSGRSGLFHAKKNGHTETVNAYVNAISDSQLNQDEKTSLLTDESDIAPSLSRALFDEKLKL